MALVLKWHICLQSQYFTGFSFNKAIKDGVIYKFIKQMSYNLLSCSEQINIWKSGLAKLGTKKASDVTLECCFTICIYSVDSSVGECTCFMYDWVINSMQMLLGHSVALLSWWIWFPDALQQFKWKPYGRLMIQYVDSIPF